MARVAAAVTLAGFAGSLLVASCAAQYTALPLSAVTGKVVHLDATLLVTPYPPPAIYRAWFREMEQCSGKRSAIPFDSLTFVAVHAEAFAAKGRGPFLGYTYMDERTIAVVADSTGSRWLVAHEMLHVVLGAPGHPQFPFLWPCNVQSSP